jgi:hypothetical protein
MRPATEKYLNVRILTNSVRSINPNNIAGENIHPNLIPECTFPFKLEQRNRVSRDSRSLLRDAHISTMYADEAVVQTATIFPAFKDNLEEIWLW